MSKKVEKEQEQEVKKVFFITSNQNKFDNFIKYETPKNHGLVNLRAGKENAEFQDEINYKREMFSVYINSMEILPKDLKDEDKDPNTRRYNGLVNLKKDKITYPGNFTFASSKNNFIYDFEFKEYLGWMRRTYTPPPQIKFTKLEQLKLYIKYLRKVLNKKQKDGIYKDYIWIII